MKDLKLSHVEVEMNGKLIVDVIKKSLMDQTALEILLDPLLE